MDVRCERCRAQYVFDDEQVTPAGLTVQCTNCGHVFKVKKKELVVTVPVKPDELQGAPLPATAAAPRPAGAAGPATTPLPAPDADRSREWRVRQANGNVFTFKELTTLQKWIIEQKVSRDDEISHGSDQWKRLGNIPDLASFFQVVEAAERGKAAAAGPAITPLPMAPVYPVAMPPVGYAHTPAGYVPSPFVVTAPIHQPVPQAAPGEPGPRRAPSGPEPGRGPRRRSSAGAWMALLAVLLLVVAGGAAVYVLRPEWLALVGLAPAPELEVPGEPGASAQSPAPAAPAAGAATAARAAAPAGDAAAPTPSRPPPAGTAAAPAGAGIAAHAPSGGDPAAQPAAPPGDVAAAPSPTPAPPATTQEGAPKPEAKPPAAAAAAKPAGPKALLAQAARLLERGDAERALDLYGRVVEVQPENAAALAGRGLCYLELSRYPPAEASFLAALAVDPREPDALLGLGETYRWQGRKADAIQYFEKYLAFHPDGEDAAVARNAISQLRE